eukprot:COSAG05_NODE_1287_length_5276_cov_10.526173_1_plen_70_part_10
MAVSAHAEEYCYCNLNSYVSTVHVLLYPPGTVQYRYSSTVDTVEFKNPPQYQFGGTVVTKLHWETPSEGG